MSGQFYKFFLNTIKCGSNIKIKCKTSSHLNPKKFCSQAAVKTQFTEQITEQIPPPTFEGENKNYSEKIVKLVNEISGLTLIEVADLNELLKKTLNLPDVPMMQSSFSFAAAAPKEEEAVVVKPEKTSFTVRIIKFDENRKVALIKEVKALVPGLNLVQAKKFVESSPSIVRSDASKEEAEKLKESLAAVGAIVEIN